jgi:2,3-bisphosphoglycerate-dependent phosphoglycerate mutase
MEIFTQIMNYLEVLANKVPLELFAFIGTIIEEILAPIPSPFVMGITGSIAKAQNKALLYLLVIALIGAIGRVVGTSFLYLISDVAEDLIIGKFGNFIGISHEKVEKIGSRFDGTAKDYITLTFLRAIPVMPSSPLSVICGIVKLKFKVFVIGTFVGSIFRNLFFIYIGYTGLAATESFMEGLDTADNIMKVLFVLGLIGGYFYFYRKREKGKLFEDQKNEPDHPEIVAKYKELKEKPTPEITKEELEKVEARLEYREVDELPKTESHKLPTLYIFRHGESVDNRKYVFSGWRTAPITKRGKEQAEVLAEKLKDKKIDKLISSPQKRALQTMEIAMSKNESAKNLKIHKDKRIKERSYGDLQGQSKLEWHKKDPEFLHRIRRTYHGQPPHGESIGMVYKRVKNFTDDLVKEMKEKQINVAISCHGNSIRCFRKYFEGLGDEETATVETQLGQDYAAYVID